MMKMPRCIFMTRTRGNMQKLEIQKSKSNLRKNFFTVRVGKYWNSLPNNVINCEKVMDFKNNLDTFWNEHPLKFDYHYCLWLFTVYYANSNLGYVNWILQWNQWINENFNSWLSTDMKIWDCKLKIKCDVKPLPWTYRPDLRLEGLRSSFICYVM